MNLPKGPRAWAGRLTQILNVAVPGADRFPVDVRGLALDYSRQVFPDDAIHHADGTPLTGCDGVLQRIPGRGHGWGIIYNDGITSAGRINFTLAHEFGHYLVHREAFPEGLRCSEDDIAAGGPGIRAVEREADMFAADLLMPFDDFRRQVAPKSLPNIETLSACANRYGVSLLAATLRWIAYTERRAIIVVSRDGFILWARSTDAALKTGAFFRTVNQPPIEVPAEALVLAGGTDADRRVGISHDKGIWLHEPCTEIAVASERYDFGLSLLLLGDAPDRRWGDADDEEDPVAIPMDRKWR